MQAVNSKCQRKREAINFVQFPDQAKPEEPTRRYAVAQVQGDVRLVERPGKTTFEARAMRCIHVMFGKDNTRKDIGEEEAYYDFESTNSTRSAILTAFVTFANHHLQARIRSNYICDKAVKTTLKGLNHAF